jgi:hypothetical protein
MVAVDWVEAVTEPYEGIGLAAHNAGDRNSDTADG